VKYVATIGERRLEIDVERDGAGGFRVAVGGRAVHVDHASVGAREVSLLLGPRSVDLYLAPGANPGEVRVANGRSEVAVTVRDERECLEDEIFGRRAEAKGPALIRSVMPGIVARVLAKPGDRDADGAALLTIEAMKMENEIRASGEGIVKRVHVKPGQTVNANDPLVEVGPVETTEPATDAESGTGA
jgi:biotin carboxyl carrier protein